MYITTNRSISLVLQEIQRLADHRGKRFAYPWKLWTPWFPDPDLVPEDLQHYLSRCLFAEPMLSVRTLWTPDEFDIEYTFPGGLADALQQGIVPFGADESDYAYILASGQIHTFKPFTYNTGPVRRSQSWASLYDFFVDAMQAEQPYSEEYLDEQARRERRQACTRRQRSDR